jgi:hypothetical protein
VPRLLARLTGLAPALVVLEATGGYEAALAAGTCQLPWWLLGATIFSWMLEKLACGFV